jgi:hypothetical protein
MAKMDRPSWDGWPQRVRALQGEVIPSVACPVIVGHKKPFLYPGKYFRSDYLPISTLKLVDYLCA